MILLSLLRIKRKRRLRKNELAKIYREKNSEKIRQQNRIRQKKYEQTEKGIKSYRIKNWKKRGVLCNDFEELYNQYCRTAYCDHCGIQLTEGKKTTPTTRCLDHCHLSGEVRNILCQSCNTKRGQSNF